MLSGVRGMLMSSPSTADLATISALPVVPSIVSNSLAALITASSSGLSMGLREVPAN